MAMARSELMVRKSLPQKNNVKAIQQKQNNNLLSFFLSPSAEFAAMVKS